MTRSIRQDVVRYLTNNPGQVVSRRDISDAFNWDERQVRDAVRRLQDETLIGDEIETIVRGNAWRYVPRGLVASTAQTAPVTRAHNLELPLTTLIREFMVDHPRSVVTVEQLVAYTGRTTEQVQAGVNNMRRIASNVDVTSYVENVASGKIWRFNPPPDWRPGHRPNRPTSNATLVPTSPLPASTVASVTTVPVTIEPTASPNGQVNGNVEPTDDMSSRVFEEVGKLRDGRLVISDQDGNMYTATPMKTPQSQ